MGKGISVQYFHDTKSIGSSYLKTSSDIIYWKFKIMNYSHTQQILIRILLDPD